MYRTKSFLPLLLLFVCALVSCNKKVVEPFLGGDRDEHDCIPSAGYTWSDALHDCIRVWEAGERFENGQKSVFLVFSADSTLAEIFTSEKAILLRRDGRHTQSWSRRKGDERVTIQPNGVVTVFAQNFYFTKTKSE